MVARPAISDREPRIAFLTLGNRRGPIAYFEGCPHQFGAVGARKGGRPLIPRRLTNLLNRIHLRDLTGLIEITMGMIPRTYLDVETGLAWRF